MGKSIKRRNIRVLLVHPEPMPAFRNRAVFQRPFFLSSHSALEILSTYSAEICDEISRNAQIHRLVGGFKRGIGRLFLWKFAVILWFFCDRLKGGNVNTLVYAYPQWGWLPLFFIKIMGFRVVVDIQHTPRYYLDWVATHGPSLTLIRKLYCYLLGCASHLFGLLVLPKMDLVVVMSHEPSEGFAKIIHEVYNVRSRRLLALPNGIELVDVPLRHKQPNNIYHFCFAGNVQPSKLQRMVKLFIELRKHHDVRLHIAGKIMSSSISWVSDIISPEIKKDIKFHGLISHEELKELYSKCDFGLFMVDADFPDHRYSHPGKVLEYMLYGCIPIVTDIPSLHYVLKDGESGITLLDEDSSSAKVLQLLSAGPEKVDELRRNAYESVKQFDWKSINNTWFNALTLFL